MNDIFEGWPQEAQRFFTGLELDNSRTYFEANRNVYEQCVRAPMVALLASVEREFGPGKVFRINRDLRFTADKTPYKRHLAAMVGSDGRGGYVSFSTSGLHVSGGWYRLDKPQIERFRAAVDAEPSGSELHLIVERLERDGYGVGGQVLKLVPRQYPRDHPRAGLLRHRGMTASRSYGLEPWLGTPAALERVVSVWRDTEPLLRWLATRVGG